MVDGGDKQDLSGILIGFAKPPGYEGEGGEGENERSLLLSLLLSSVNMMMLRMLSAFQNSCEVGLCWLLL